MSYQSEFFKKADGAEKLKWTSIEDIQSRIVALIDMDCFYVQVEQRLTPEFIGKPCAVVQYNEWKGGGILAVGYEARAMGVQRRRMRGEEAREVCPDIKLFKVPEVRGKADLTRYREAGAEVIAVLMQFSKCKVERASIDEAYIDMTDEIQEMMSRSCQVSCDDLPNTFVVGSDDGDREKSMKEWLEFTQSPDCLESHNNIRLAFGALLVEKMRRAIKEQTGFNCSAGISHNKVLSKLACGLHKPQKQTILSLGSVSDLFATLPIAKVRHLGGKLGEQLMEDYTIQYMGDICAIDKKELKSQYGEKTANFLYDICRGHDPEPVNSRQLVQSVGCSKNFRRPNLITTYKKARHWIHQLSEEVEERLVKDREQNRRISKSLSLSVRFSNWQSLSRAIPISRYSQQAIESAAMAALTKVCGEGATKIDPAISCLGLSAGKFEDIDGQNLKNYFHKGADTSVVDPFDSIPSPSKPSNPPTSAKSTSTITSYIGSSATVNPFDSITSSPPRNVEANAKSSNKPPGCDIKAFVSKNLLEDPFEKLEKLHPRVYDGGTVPGELAVPSIPAENKFDMKFFVIKDSTADPFDTLKISPPKNNKPSAKVNANSTSAQANSIKCYTSSNNIDPFASISDSPRKRKITRSPLKRYTKNSNLNKLKEVENTLYDPNRFSVDILDVYDPNRSSVDILDVYDPNRSSVDILDVYDKNETVIDIADDEEPYCNSDTELDVCNNEIRAPVLQNSLQITSSSDIETENVSSNDNYKDVQGEKEVIICSVNLDEPRYIPTTLSPHQHKLDPDQCTDNRIHGVEVNDTMAGNHHSEMEDSDISVIWQSDKSPQQSSLSKRSNCSSHTSKVKRTKRSSGIRMESQAKIKDFFS